MDTCPNCEKETLQCVDVNYDSDGSMNYEWECSSCGYSYHFNTFDSRRDDPSDELYTHEESE